MDNLYRIIKSRRSIRKFVRKQVKFEIIEKLLTSGCWAPSPHNSQPWRFVILGQDELKRKLSIGMGERLKEDLKKDRLPLKMIDRRIRRSLNLINRAPVLILVCLSKEGLHVYPDSRRNRIEEYMALQSIGASIQNILLETHSMGLGACWISAPIFCPKLVVKTLKIPKGWSPTALLLLGYPNEKPKTPSRFKIKLVSMRLK
jgi:coenzyme F420-0:L-glutamate ligase/coenzyme F420-1:gamma-L-glutamate ligase